MTKQEFISKLPAYEGVTKVMLTDIVSTVFNTMDEVVSNGETLCYEGRRVKLVTRKPRMGRNPRTGESIQIPERKYVTYRKQVA